MLLVVSLWHYLRGTETEQDNPNLWMKEPNICMRNINISFQFESLLVQNGEETKIMVCWALPHVKPHLWHFETLFRTYKTRQSISKNYIYIYFQRIYPPKPQYIHFGS